MVEIGGGFRVPEVLELSGARLVEVGTTNRTRLDDYRRAVASSADVAAVLKVHQSNYRIQGFTESVDIGALAGLGIPVVADLGSGLLDANAPWLDGPPPAWLSGEPAVRQSLRAGAVAVTFSGDKLLGGPQAGIVAGHADIVAACAAHPLARALRPGALTLLALQETLLAYLRRDGSAIPFWKMASATVEELRRRAEEILRAAGSRPEMTLVDCESAAGGGSVPGLGIPSVGIGVLGDRRAALRAGDPPIVALVRDGHTVLDVRSIDAVQDPAVAKALSGLRW
jgi:L-seryl-tRNA(Ser) seleniumtransferase